MAVVEDVIAARDLVKDAVKDLALGIPPIGVSVSNLAGLSLQQWVYVVTIAYTAFLILMQVPRAYGCMLCFYKHGTCLRKCKS